MKKIVKVSIIITAIIGASSCGYITPRKIPTLGLSQDGSDECPTGERIYYYRNVDAAICLPDVMVAYTHCVTELTIANDNSTSSSTTSFEVGKILDKVDGLKLSNDQKRELERAFVDSGVIGEARAKAIDACKEITMKAYSGEIATDLTGAKLLFNK